MEWRLFSCQNGASPDCIIVVVVVVVVVRGSCTRSPSSLAVFAWPTTSAVLCRSPQGLSVTVVHVCGQVFHCP